MDTISKRLKDTVRNTMRKEETYSNEAIRQLIYGKTGMKYGVDYKETHFAGCLSALKKSGEIIQVQRGEYIKGDVKSISDNKLKAEPKEQDFSAVAVEEMRSMQQIRKGVMQSVQGELVYLKSVAQKIVLSFDTPEEDIQYMLKLKELVKSLEEFAQYSEGD